MFTVKSSGVLAFAAGLAVLAGCGSVPAGQPSPSSAPRSPAASAPVSGTPAPSGTRAPASSGACAAAGTYLTAIQTGQHAGFDRVVFEFSGGTPAYGATVVKTVYADPEGDDEPGEEPPVAEYDPGPECDDQGGMSEYRYVMPEHYQRGQS